MSNLNETDLLVGDGKKFKNLEKFIENTYGFKIIKTHYPNSVSLTSRKAILETSAGQFFLKEKPLYCSDETSLKRSFLFQDYCSKKTNCVPSIIKTNNNAFYFNFEVRKYFLSEYIEGRHFNGSRDDIIKAIGVISEINIIGQKFLKQKNLPPDVKRKFDSFDIATLIPELGKYTKSDKEMKIVSTIKKTFKNLSEEYMAIGSDVLTMSHSDCILFNFIFSGDGTYLIDFDNAKVLPRIHDFAEFFVSATLLNYLAAITNLKKPVLLKFSAEPSKTIINFYKDNIKFSEKEMALFQIVCDIVWLWTLCLSVIKGDYLIGDITEAVKVIRNKTNRKKISAMLANKN